MGTQRMSNGFNGWFGMRSLSMGTQRISNGCNGWERNGLVTDVTDGNATD
ncbi:MAG: hypothetical protein F6J93_15695 [Oscillatoria sp. SIO1A7]|nr:hypothetical protein [Oscillatoria sp. SIO1A7]